MEGYFENHYSLLYRNNFSFKTIQEFSLAMLQNHRLIWKLINKMSWWWNSGSAEDDFALWIYDCRDFDLRRGIHMRKRASREKKNLIDWEDGVFSLLSLCHLSKYTCASHMFHIFVQLNIKTNVGVQSITRVIIWSANCAFE